MSKKNIDTAAAVNKFFTQDTQSTQEKHYKQDTQEKRRPGRPTKTPEERKRGYRYNLTLDKDLNSFLHFMAWKNKTSMTQFINDTLSTGLFITSAAAGSHSADCGSLPWRMQQSGRDLQT